MSRTFSVLALQRAARAGASVCPSHARHNAARVRIEGVGHMTLAVIDQQLGIKLLGDQTIRAGERSVQGQWTSLSFARLYVHL